VDEGSRIYLWRIVQGGARNYGQISVSDEQVATLRKLAERAGGWVRFGDEDEEFVSFEEWEKQYRVWELRRT